MQPLGAVDRTFVYIVCLRPSSSRWWDDERREDARRDIEKWNDDERRDNEMRGETLQWGGIAFAEQGRPWWWGGEIAYVCNNKIQRPSVCNTKLARACPKTRGDTIGFILSQRLWGQHCCRRAREFTGVSWGGAPLVREVGLQQKLGWWLGARSW